MCYKKLILRTGMVFFSTMLLQMWSISFGFVTNQDASVVIGQVNFERTVRSCSDSTFESPKDIWYDGTYLFVVDGPNDNNRVLIYNGILTENNAHADVVVGQVDMNTTGSGCSDSILRSPCSVCSDGTRLYIADGMNNRVLIYNQIPTENNAHADVVVGQVDMNSDSFSGYSDSTLYFPYFVYSDGVRLFISNGGRVLIYNEIPTQNNAHADVVIGQVDMNSDVYKCSDSTFSRAGGVYFDGTKLYIVDTGNNRVLIYNEIPTENNAHANVVVGQVDMDSTDYGYSDSTFFSPKDVWVDSNRLSVSDLFNSRILIFEPIPTENNAYASVVLGQPDMESYHQNQGNINPSANTLSYPRGICYASGKLFVADEANARCLIYEDTLAGIEERKCKGENKIKLSLFPNPSTGKVFIRYFLPFQSTARIEMFDIAGRVVKVLREDKRKGWHSVMWNGKSNTGDMVSPGIYFSKLRIGDFEETKKVVIFSQF